VQEAISVLKHCPIPLHWLLVRVILHNVDNFRGGLHSQPLDRQNSLEKYTN